MELRSELLRTLAGLAHLIEGILKGIHELTFVATRMEFDSVHKKRLPGGEALVVPVK